MTQTNQNNEPVIIENDTDYEALSLAWDIEEQTGDVDNGSLSIGTMPRLYVGDLSDQMPVLTGDDLEEITEVAGDIISAVKKKIDDYNAATTQGIDSAASGYDVPAQTSDRPYTGIHDASELEDMARQEELQKMDDDGLYVKVSVEYNAGMPELKATRWDGKVLGADELMDGIAHYVHDMKANGNKIPFEVGEALMGIDMAVLESAYGKDIARKFPSTVLEAMTPEYGRKVA